MHLHLKYAKSAIMTQKKFFLEKYQFGYQKTQKELYADFKFVDAGLNKCPQKKLEPKTYANFENFRVCAFFPGFLLLTFVRGISESRHFCQNILILSNKQEFK